jgi:nitrogen-specific signal transduction histidine kinase/CheY-like chemotaxis protein
MKAKAKQRLDTGRGGRKKDGRKKVEDKPSGTEEQLRLIQKMDAVGRLAGGVAHDFNNILTVILGYGDLLLGQMGPGDPMRAEVEQIVVAGERASALTRQLLAFSRQQLVDARALDLNELITDLDKMIRGPIGDDIEFRTVVAPGLGLVMADKGQIEQVVMDLVVNAREAMPQGGKMLIETANVELDEGYADEHLDAVPGAYVMLAVTDTGCGMDAATREKIFEPFFTTKARGHGIGLGLSTVYGIVRQCGGNIRVHSEVGRGTTVKIHLPRSTGGAANAVAPAARRLAQLNGSETVLLVEDDPQLRVMAKAILAGRGYQVLEAPGGAEALEIAGKPDVAIHLLLTDLIMPKMNGRDLVKQMAKLRPTVKVLLMSGYTDSILGIDDPEIAARALLRKPFTPEGLLRKVREAIGPGAPPPRPAGL